MTPRVVLVILILSGVSGCRLEQVVRTPPPPDSARRSARVDSAAAGPPAGTHLLGLRTASYVATDLDSAKAWYQQVTGVTPYFDQPFYVGFNIGGYELGITPPAEGRPPSPGSTIAYWGVANVDSTWQHLLRLGAVVHDPIEDVGGGIRIGVVRDPFDNLVGLIENPRFRVGW